MPFETQQLRKINKFGVMAISLSLHDFMTYKFHGFLYKRRKDDLHFFTVPHLEFNI